MKGIFISYRREDSAGYAGRLYDRLATQFGADNVFMDVEGIEPGVDFVDAIGRAVGSCEVLIVIIGREWLSAGHEGKRRIDDPSDFVRIETAAALVRGIRVVPVLVEGAAMPRADELPDTARGAGAPPGGGAHAQAVGRDDRRADPHARKDSRREQGEGRHAGAARASPRARRSEAKRRDLGLAGRSTRMVDRRGGACRRGDRHRALSDAAMERRRNPPRARVISSSRRRGCSSPISRNGLPVRRRP